MEAEQGTLTASVPRRSCLREPNMRRKNRKTDTVTDSAIGIEGYFSEPIKAKATAALPVDIARDSTLLAFDNSLQTGRTKGNGLLSHLNSDVATPHLVRYGCGGPGPKKRIEDEVALL